MDLCARGAGVKTSATWKTEERGDWKKGETQQQHETPAYGHPRKGKTQDGGLKARRYNGKRAQDSPSADSE